MWSKGQSGNKNGRPRSRLDFTRKLRKRSPEMIAALFSALHDKETVVGAAKILLAYAWGKPLDMELTLSEVPHDIFWREAERRTRRAEADAAARTVEEPAKH